MQISRTMIRKILYSGMQATNSSSYHLPLHPPVRLRKHEYYGILTEKEAQSLHCDEHAKRVYKRFDILFPYRVPKREMGDPRTHLLSGRTANGALAEWRPKDFWESKLGLARPWELLLSPRSASFIRLIRISQFSRSSDYHFRQSSRARE